MLIEPVDEYRNLFRLENVFPDNLVKSIVNTDWFSVPWRKQEGQEIWPRRRLEESSLSWIEQWHECCRQLWPVLGAHINWQVQDYFGTAWWLDEPEFWSPIHTDGEMPGAIQIYWIGESHLGTGFYHYKNENSLRHQFDFRCNCGYMMLNVPNDHYYRHLQWHGMVIPVPANTFRLSSYSWIFPKT